MILDVGFLACALPMTVFFVVTFCVFFFGDPWEKMRDREFTLAKRGAAWAQFRVGVMYEDGKEVSKDYRQAFMWYRRAAEQGYAGAQFNLGVMYETGRGVSKDLVQAYAWYDLAQAQEVENAKEWRDELELSAKELAEAQALSAQIHKRIEKRTGRTNPRPQAPANP